MIWRFGPELISWGALHVRWYGLLFATGFLTGYSMMRKMFENEGVSAEVVDRLFVYVFAATLIGARLGHCLFYEPEVYLRDPIRILMIWEGGLASHGGTIGIIFAIWLFARRTPEVSLLFTMDRQAIVSAWMAGLIRIGNLFNSEIIGRPTDVPWAVTFARVDALPRHPSQVYEALAYLALFAVFRQMYKIKKYREQRGLFIGMLLAYCFTARFFIEFLKENQVAFESSLPLNMGQLLSIPLIIAGVWLVIRSKRPSSRQQKPAL